MLRQTHLRSAAAARNLAVIVLILTQLACSFSRSPAQKKTPENALPVPGVDFSTSVPAQDPGLEVDPTAGPRPLLNFNPDQKPFLQLFPAAARAPAPAWFGSGVRITYSVASTTTTRDPEGSNTSGSGLLQYDLAAVDGELVAGNARFFLDTDLAGTYHPTPPAESWGVLGAGDYWVNPRALVGAENLLSDELKVIQGPATVSGREYQALRIEYRSGHNLSIWMLDTQTGLLIYYRSQVGAETDFNQTNSILSLVGMRPLRLPWAGARVPAAGKAGKVYTYSGAQTLRMTNTPDQSLPVSVTAKVLKNGSTWSQLEYTDSASRPAVPSRRVTGVSQLTGAAWLPAEALQARWDGRTVDTDPLTGVAVSLSEQGGLLCITETGKAFQAVSAYDPASGLLVSYRQELRSPLTTILLELQLQ